MSTSELIFPWAEPPPIGTLRQVAEGVLWLRLPLPYRLNHVNVYLIAEEGGFAVVDTGLGDADTQTLWRQLLGGPLAGQKLTRLIATHFHPDHVGLAGWMWEQFGMPLHMPRSEYLFSIALEHAPPDRGEAMYRQYYARNGLLYAVANEVVSNGHEYLRRTTGVPSVYHRLQHGQELRLGSRVFQVLTGGGHAMEQAMLYSAHDRLFLSADQVIAKISPNVSVHAIEPQADPLGDYLRSLRSLIDAVPSDVLVLPGHGLPFCGLHTRIEELIVHHADRCAQISKACSTLPRSAAELIPFVFTRVMDAHQTGFAFGETLAHINYMVARSELRAVNSKSAVQRFTV
jgi:glyoxylase-like metal-dependent hydrolase (beta-lactamase superfamily II)